MSFYHSALADELDLGLDPVEAFAFGRVQALACDLALWQVLPPAFEVCDVIYGEPPFQVHEAQLFRERAGAIALDRFRDDAWGFLQPIRCVIRQGGPVVLIGGLPLQTQMPAPDSALVPIRLERSGKRGQGVRARALGWNIDLPLCKTTGELIAHLIERFKCVGDPFCGYGRTGELFARSGRSAVLSDINPRCIAYIAQRAEGWQL